MVEINLLDRYPESKRPIEERGERKLSRKGWLKPIEEKENIDIIMEYKLLEKARQFGKEYFDGDRLFGYGGYYYHPKFWTETAKRFMEHYKLKQDASILDVGCAKGFLLFEFKRQFPKLNITGIDISRYAIENAKKEVKKYLSVVNAKELPFKDNTFDLVISINTVDHLPLDECKQAIKEIQRVSKKHSFISVNAWRNENEKELLLKWNVTAKTCMHIIDWKKLFKEIGYTRDYYWFIAE